MKLFRNKKAGIASRMRKLCETRSSYTAKVAACYQQIDAMPANLNDQDRTIKNLLYEYIGLLQNLLVEINSEIFALEMRN